MNKKIYCENCKFTSSVGCLCIIDKTVTTHEYIGKKTHIRYGNEIQLNFEGACKYYKCKLWKFWVK